MTPPLAPTLPPWPEKPTLHPCYEYAWVDYYEALASAALARLAMAVGLLRSMSGMVHPTHVQPDIDAVLAAIGPLPPLPDMPKAEKGE